MKNWQDASPTTVADMTRLRDQIKPFTKGGVFEMRMKQETWRAMKAAAMSGTIMRFVIGTLAGAIIGAYAVYRWETRR